MQVALIPVKELSLAKERLSGVLDEGARRQLALALFRDVLATAIGCRSIDRVSVVSEDEEVLTLTREAGADVAAVPGDLNEALTSAAEAAAEQGAKRVVVLAADLPMIRTDDIEAVADAEADVAIVRSSDRGTNALAVPPGAIAFQFGPKSGDRHLAAAKKAGLKSTPLDLPMIAFDIDTPDDLIKLRIAAEGGDDVGPNTLKTLQRIGIVRRGLRKS